MMRALALAVVVAATALTLAPLGSHEFVNWDDPATLVTNAALQQPWPAVAAWAVTTTHMGHYQPLSWLAYRLAGAPPSAPAVHAASLVLHLLNVGLLFWLTARLAAFVDGGSEPDDWWLLAATTALFAVHPLRVEPVAWASALPYLLSYAPLLLAVGAWLTWLRHGPAVWYWVAVGAVTVSQLARVTAPLVPLVLLALAALDRAPQRRPWREVARAAALVAVVVAPLAWLEAGARDIESLADIPLAPRLAWTLSHPAAYVWRLLAPGALSPLDVLPRDPSPDWGVAVVAVLATAVVVATTTQLASRRVALAVWGSYLLLLLPVVGLLPSGVQLTADRYVYGPAMVLSAALGVALLGAPDVVRRTALVAAGAAAVALGLSARAQTAYWHDSTALWTRAVTLDAGNDIALFNLAQARAEAGDAEAAIRHYERLVALVPDHEPAKRALGGLIADREQRAADAAAQAGRLHEAVGRYDRALAADPARTGARVNRGMALASLGEFARAVPDLQAGPVPAEPPVASALAFALSAAGRAEEALAVLAAAVAAHPDDFGLAANHARLLLTAEPSSLRDPQRGLALAARAAQATGMRDPRLLDLVGLGFAAVGQPADARQAWTRGAALAREAGDTNLAAAIGARLASLPR